MGIGIRKQWVAAGVLVSAMLSTLPAMAAMDAYMVIKGAKQGSIKGDAGVEKIPIKSVTHDVVMGSDRATGMATGKRQHGSITIMKSIDKASPMLFRALNDHEVLNQVTIVLGGSGAGSGKAAQMIELKDAMIASVRNMGTSEAITIDYETVQVTYTSGNKSATDAWDAK